MGVEAVAFTDDRPVGADSELPVRAIHESPLTVVGWLWRDPKCKTQYAPEHASIWARMIHRHLTIPHRFVLITDQPDAYYDPLITLIPLWNDWREIKNEEWGTSRPHCYVRLKAFSPQAEEIIGKRFVSIDLDCVVLKNLDSLFDRPEDFLIYRRPLTMIPQDEINTYQGSMWMMTAGARRKVWDEFKGLASIRGARKYMGTDQAWMRHCLGPDEPGWKTSDGVYGWPALRDDESLEQRPPENARIVFFYGNKKPWDFASLDRPHCDHCGQDIKIKPPWELTLNRRGALNRYQWIARNYR